MKTKTPLKAPPLNNPGESTQAQYSKVRDDFMAYVVGAVLSVMMAIYEWYRWITDAPLSPGSLTFVALLFVALAIWKYVTVRKKRAAYRQGIAGEKAVGQFLEGLRKNGATFVHDVPGDGFNIDHIIFHDSGIYVVETKTWSKPAKGSPKLFFDGETISCPGLFNTSDPVIQVKAGRRWVCDLLKETTGREFLVKSVLLFPGWFIESNVPSDIWVLNPKALPAFIANAPPVMKPEDVKLCESRISDHSRMYSARATKHH